ncbi:YciI family protein [Luteipulveratus flavus]|uniref:YciI family protein n=1 Tax=Luteipulveratus flavus TaxID=3031728 RepID=A0ABT6CB34_9MICO|nr:YciI family protein [Luteipulveratus sp. YIM 133296]MDF8266105.1 YciI family protein [Luteipulveratus sp. YIM 133296]
MPNLFVLDLTYPAGPDAVAPHLEAHRKWLREQYAQGRLLASGRKEPRTGGVIIARGTDRAEVEALVETDPFLAEGVAAYTVTEFAPTMTAPELEHLRVTC